MIDEKAARGETAARVEQIFREAGAYRDGHFQLKSGRHGDRYIEKFEVLQWPDRVAELVGMMVGKQRPAAGGTPDAWRFARSSAVSAAKEDSRASGVGVVVGPTIGGVILAYECARQLGVRGIFAEEVSDTAGQNHRALRRGFRIQPGERVMLVDDVVTTGGSLAEMVPLIEAAGGELVLVSVLVDRSGGLHEVESRATGRSYAVDALWSLSLPTYEAGADCPGCAAGVPLHAPGSSGTKQVSPS